MCRDRGLPLASVTKANRSSIYHRHRFPPDVIAYAVWLYFRFPLSLRMVKDPLAERGIIVSHQTVRMWAGKFGREYAKNIRRRSAGNFDGKWHLDEVVITMRGEKHWLWRAVDQDGFVLDVLVQRQPRGCCGNCSGNKGLCHAS